MKSKSRPRTPTAHRALATALALCLAPCLGGCIGIIGIDDADDANDVNRATEAVTCSKRVEVHLGGSAPATELHGNGCWRVGEVDGTLALLFEDGGGALDVDLLAAWKRHRGVGVPVVNISPGATSIQAVTEAIARVCAEVSDGGWIGLHDDQRFGVFDPRRRAALIAALDACAPRAGARAPVQPPAAPATRLSEAAPSQAAPAATATARDDEPRAPTATAPREPGRAPLP